MKVLFDTSALVSGLWVAHPKHLECIDWLRQVNSGLIQGIIATHTLAELYSTLTALPIHPRLSPQLVQQLIADNLTQFDVIFLTIEDYQTVIKQMVELNLTGGAIYDALIARVAVKAEVDRLLTLNPRHFTRLGEQIAQLVTLPR